MEFQESPSPHEQLDEPALVALAMGGDRASLERLLLAHYDRLAERIGSKLPPRLQATQAVEDILQLTFLQAFRDIGSFQSREDAGFGDWLARIADHRLLDAIKHHDRAKRGGDMQRAPSEIQGDSSVLSLLDWIAADDTSPPSAAARAEAVAALHVALASLPSDQRAAIQLRLLDGKSLEETATELERTPDAVRGLVQRGKEELKAALGRASRWYGGK
jgi:RNA polymerase sigma-70 factor (ECF subfamily)